VKNDKVTEKTFTLTDAKEGSNFEFRVSAVNKAGQGPASAASPSAKYGQLLLSSQKKNKNMCYNSYKFIKLQLCI